MTDSDGADVNNFGFEYITTAAVVSTYQAGIGIFESLLKEIKELSRKKPDATISASKVKIINRVLADLLTFLKSEPEGKYLEVLDDEALPQMSDAVLIMVQFQSAIQSFKVRYNRYVDGSNYWITKELLAEWASNGGPDDDEG